MRAAATAAVAAPVAASALEHNRAKTPLARPGRLTEDARRRCPSHGKYVGQSDTRNPPRTASVIQAGGPRGYLACTRRRARRPAGARGCVRRHLLGAAACVPAACTVANLRRVSCDQSPRLKLPAQHQRTVGRSVCFASRRITASAWRAAVTQALRPAGTAPRLTVYVA